MKYKVDNDKHETVSIYNIHIIIQISIIVLLWQSHTTKRSITISLVEYTSMTYFASYT